MIHQTLSDVNGLMLALPLTPLFFDFAVGVSGTNYLLNFLMIVLFIARLNLGAQWGFRSLLWYRRRWRLSNAN